MPVFSPLGTQKKLVFSNYTPMWTKEERDNDTHFYIWENGDAGERKKEKHVDF